jgi:glycosyltransferase involved in cell wall biosynthesis
VSRLLPYKNVDVVVEAFRGLDERLVVVGHGPLARELQRSLPPNARLLPVLTDAELRWVYAHAQVLLAPSIEDFGLTPLEAAAFGRPTLALRAGGYLDTVREGVTGAFFDRPRAEEVRQAVRHAQDVQWDATRIREHADGFGEARFRARLRDEVNRLSGSRVPWVVQPRTIQNGLGGRPDTSTTIQTLLTT